MTFMGANMLAVLAATLGFLVVGFLWYGPIFGKAWLALNNKTPEDFKGRGWAMPLGIFNSAVTAFVLAIVMAKLGITDMAGGVKIAFLLWLGFSATTHMLAFIWEAQPLKLTLIHMGNQLLGLLTAGAIIGAL